MSRVGVITWDWREQPDLDRLDYLLANLSNGRVRAFAPKTSSDEYAVVIAVGDEGAVDQAGAQAAYDHWWRGDPKPADMFAWPPAGSSGSSSRGTT